MRQYFKLTKFFYFARNKYQKIPINFLMIIITLSLDDKIVKSNLNPIGNNLQCCSDLKRAKSGRENGKHKLKTSN